MESPSITNEQARARHEERLRHSLETYNRSTGVRRRVRPRRCPLSALAQWFASRRRRTRVVGPPVTP